MYQRWKDEVNFLVVYIREAHPFPRGSKKKGKTVIPEPLDLAEREEHGSFCVKDLALSIPMVLDGMDNKVGEAYAGWPDRIYVLDAKGTIRFVDIRDEDLLKGVRQLLTEQMVQADQTVRQRARQGL